MLALPVYLYLFSLPLLIYFTLFIHALPYSRFTLCMHGCVRGLFLLYTCGVALLTTLSLHAQILVARI